MKSSFFVIGAIFILIGTLIMANRIFNFVQIFGKVDYKQQQLDKKTKIIILLITTGVLPFLFGVFCILVSLIF